MTFIQIIYASIRMQHKNYFFNKSIYISLTLWPLLAFFTTYFSYMNFSQEAIYRTIGLGSREEVFVYLLIGFMGMKAFYVLIQSAWQSAYTTRFTGTLELIYMSPACKLAIMIGNAIASLLGSIWFLLVFFVGMMVLFYDIVGSNALDLLIGLVILIVTATCWGVFLNSLFLSSRDSGFLFTVFQTPVEMFSGAQIPYGLMPLWAKIIGAGMPLTYMIHVLRKVGLYGVGYGEAAMDLLIALCLSGVLLGVSYVILSSTEKSSKRNGSAVLF